jgi:hypothetical protein
MELIERLSKEATGGEDVLRVEGGFEAVHEGEIAGRSTPKVDGKSLATVRDGDNALPIGRGEKERGVAPTRVGLVSWVADCIAKLDGCEGDMAGAYLTGGSGEQGQIDGAVGAGDECVGQGVPIGDLLQACQEGGVVAGKNADLENHGGRRGLEKHG